MPAAARPHPPTSPGPIESDDSLRVWPTVIGILVLAIQALGVLGAILSAVSLYIDYSRIFAPLLGSQALDAQMAWRPHLTAVYASTCLLSLLAFTGAALLFRRRRRGVHLLVIWSLLRIPHALFAGWTQASAQRDAAANMQPMMGPQAMPPGFMDVMFVGTFIWTAAFALALPLFLLIWFAMPGIRKQTRAWT